MNDYIYEEYKGKVDMQLYKQHSGKEDCSDIIIIMKNMIGKMFCKYIYNEVEEVKNDIYILLQSIIGKMLCNYIYNKLEQVKNDV